MILEALFFAILSSARVSSAEEPSVQPYIDRLKKDYKIEESNPGQTEPYIEERRKKLGIEPGAAPAYEGYTDRLRNSDPKFKKEAEEAPGESYSEKIRTGLESKEEGGAIAAVKEGRSELHAKRLGDIHHAIAVRFAPVMARTATAQPAYLLRNYSDVYGGNWTPQVDFQYEIQPFHSEWFGNIGICFLGSLAVSHGFGQFPFPLVDATDGTFTRTFATTSHTNFQFFTVPLGVGANYRFNLLRILRPYVAAFPLLIGFAENRNDGVSAHKGYSKGFIFSGGVNVLLDWFSPGSAWNYYLDYGVKHFYLTIDYSKLTTVASPVSFSTSGISAGLTFEY